MMNPYAHTTLFTFVTTFCQRLMLFVSGKLPLNNLSADELQIGVLVSVAIACSLVGVFLIHRKMTMLANALSHTVIFGIVMTFILLKKSFHLIDPSLSFHVMFIASLITGLLTAVLAQWISQYTSLQKDASIGLVFTTFFALGILLITLFSKNGHIGIDMIMGNVDALHLQDLKSMFQLLLLMGALLLVFYRGLKISTFDPIFSKLQGFSPKFYNYLIIFMLSLSSIGAFRAVGVVLVLAFFIVPPLFAQLFANSLKKQIIFATSMGAMSAFLGVALSRHFLSTLEIAFSTGGITVLTLYMGYFLSHALKKIYKAYKNNSSKLSLSLQSALKDE